MDYTQNLSDLTAASSSQGSVSAQALGVKAGIDAAIAIINAGYQSDADAIAATVVEQVGQVQTENATLTTELATANGTITTLQGQSAQIQTILADGTGSDNQIQEITALLAG